MASANRFKGHYGGVSGKTMLTKFFGHKIYCVHVVAVDHHNVGGFIKNKFVVFFYDFEDAFVDSAAFSPGNNMSFLVAAKKRFDVKKGSDGGGCSGNSSAF